VASFEPADYITLASTFHAIFIDGVPVFAFSQKNEARRFITLLDALYETCCKLVIRAESDADDLFFPEKKVPSRPPVDSETQPSNEDCCEAIYPENRF
jgi:predicted ATPase